MYQQRKRGRLALICGAGISEDAHIPLWKDLVKRIAEKVESLNTDSILHFESKGNPAYLTQIAYKCFVNHYMSKNANAPQTIADEHWIRIVHDSIYKDCDSSMRNILRDHPYLEQLAILAFKCPLVVTFNFDNLLSEAMSEYSSGLPGGVQRPTLPDITVALGLVNKPDATTIFHINGLLPKILRGRRGEQLVFTENSFADAMVSANSLEYNHLLISLSNYTNLIVGHSLNDASLKNLLRGARNRTPAQLNYYVHWMENEDSLSEHVKKDIFDVNLDVYNLVTIFATTSDIKSIIELVNMRSDDEFRDQLRELNIYKSRYPFYVTGPVAAGKTSILRHLRYFQTYEEWVDPVPAEMYSMHHKLSNDERMGIEDWVLGQIYKKNVIMKKDNPGFYFMDRGPLDLLAFSETSEERSRKIEKLLKQSADENQLVNGQVQYVFAQGDILQERNTRRGRLPNEGGDSKYLSRQGEDLLALYSTKHIYDSAKKNAGEVAREFAVTALLGEYNETNLHEILTNESKK